MYLIFDTETTGLPKDWNLSYQQTDNWPLPVQLAWQLHDKWGNLIEQKSFLIQSKDLQIPFEVEKVHGISTLLAQKKGSPIEEVCTAFNTVLEQTEFVVGHNISFDINVMGAAFCRLNQATSLHDKKILDTCNEKSAKICAAIKFIRKGDVLELKRNKFGDVQTLNGLEIRESIFFKNQDNLSEKEKIRNELSKWQDWNNSHIDFLISNIKKQKFPTLGELYLTLFEHSFDEAHNATADVEATARCFFEMLRTYFYSKEELVQEENYLDELREKNQQITSLIGLKHQNLKIESVQCYSEQLFYFFNEKNNEEILHYYKLIERLVSSTNPKIPQIDVIFQSIRTEVLPYFLNLIETSFNENKNQDLYKLFLQILPLSIPSEKINPWVKKYEQLILTDFSELENTKEYITLASKYLEYNPFFITYKLDFIHFRNKVLDEFKLLLKNENVETTIIDLYKKLNPPFVHLHNHSQYSILQSTSTVSKLVDKAIEYQMPAIALTDCGNLYAAFIFEQYISKKNKEYKDKILEKSSDKEIQINDLILPIIGCEFNLCENHADKKVKDNGTTIVLLAKSKKGYQNLIKLSSISFIDGFYYVPRIDKNLLVTYKEDLIVLSGGINGEISWTIDRYGVEKANENILWWKETFQDDFYLEITRLGIKNEAHINEALVRLSNTHQIKLVATNNTYFINKKDANTCEILHYVKEGMVKSEEDQQIRKFKVGLENEEYYFKSPDEMKKLFADLPQAIESISDILSKIESYSLQRDVLLPAFDIPEEFQDPNDINDGGKRGENNYLRYITYEGAKKRYGDLSDEIKERIEFELNTIKNTGYPGYFLIVQDFCNASREMDVWVGPGRGSAAGSVVAYSIGITNIDPIKYNLLFERFLNPDRVSLPDIDIDFEDEGRGKVIDWVINKYGSKQVAQIITYGTMAAKSAIKDAGRVLGLPIHEQDSLTKMMPNISLKKLLETPFENLEKIIGDRQDEIAKARQLISVYKGNDELKLKVLNQAKELEGSVRNTGIHACGVIITPDDISDFVPVTTAKDSQMICTQFDNHVVDHAGLLKMDFLGLKTLTTIKQALKIIKSTKSIEIDPDLIPIDDEKTYELFQKGETVGVFQFESPGMQKHLKDLKPTIFEDLIAMNALYRPGPMDYIPKFIARKHGKEEISYDIDDCEEFLKETYGITVYQEQVMLLSQKLANFSKGNADSLRKAMGKKQASILEEMKPKFIEGGAINGHDKAKLEKIWSDWNAFAEYAFNKSHSTCYSWVAYQTAYLKANFPSEFMASCLSGKMNDIKEIAFLMEECKRMGINVLIPDINESEHQFIVSKDGNIRFGLGAIKGLSTASVDEIIKKRTENGPFKSIFDLTKRVDLRIVNKKTLEALVYSGCFDSFSLKRSQYLLEDKNGKIFIENVIKYANAHKENANSDQMNMFGDSEEMTLYEPEIPQGNDWSIIQKLIKEKEVVGIYISGHPLDTFKKEINALGKGSISDIKNKNYKVNQEFLVAGIITLAEHKMSKKNEPYGRIVVDGIDDSTMFSLFGETYLKNKHMLDNNLFVYIHGVVEKHRYRDELDFNIKTIDLLHNLREKRTKALLIKIKNENVDSIIIQNLKKIFDENKGNHPLKILINEDNNFVELKSKNIKINANDKMINEIEKLNLIVELVG
ncbi:MAG: DNA polymerase III subunit alpha [Flavobacteriia bacterium]|nr:DNA polymerase III subunit alpha [Flavobacteriia bacterium]